MTPEQMERAYKAGIDLRVIANQARLSHETVRKRLKKRGVKLRRCGRPGGLTPAQLEEAKALYKNGFSLSAVAGLIGANTPTVRYTLILHGVKMRTRSQALALYNWGKK